MLKLLRTLAALAAPIAIALLLLLPAREAGAHATFDEERPSLEIVIAKATQRMAVYADGALLQAFTVSTGKKKHETPSGTFRALWLNRLAYAPKYDNAPMPHSIFFTKAGHAIHATGHLEALGRPASHGCVRLAPEAAAWLFALVREYGVKNTVIHVQ